jgi:hypothetical protein
MSESDKTVLAGNEITAEQNRPGRRDVGIP